MMTVAAVRTLALHLAATAAALAALSLTACGRESSRLLRQGQLPIYDFPLYLTEGAAGRLWKIDRDRNKTARRLHGPLPERLRR